MNFYAPPPKKKRKRKRAFLKGGHIDFPRDNTIPYPSTRKWWFKKKCLNGEFIRVNYQIYVPPKILSAKISLFMMVILWSKTGMLILLAKYPGEENMAVHGVIT